VAAARAKRAYPSAIAVERAADLLVLLADRTSASVMELAEAAELSGSAVHRILTALKRKGLVEQDPASERYRLSWGILTLARALVNRDQLRALALPHMAALRDLTGETVTLYARSGFDRICLEQLEGTHEIRYRAEIGRSLPLYAGASGLALLAHLPQRDLEEFLTSVELERITPHTLRGRDALERTLVTIREQGYALASNDRVLGLAGLSAPIFDESGSAVAVITIAGPGERLLAQDVDSWIRALRQATQDVSVVLLGRAEVESATSASG
jgi:DNA-binding IclR family transcriptional regulator